MMTADSNKCAVCNEPASKRCQRCKSSWYCCREHQVSDWQSHKARCKAPSLEEMLAEALAKLEAAGGKEWRREVLTPMILPGEDYEDDDDAGPPSTEQHEYLKELLKVGELNYLLGQYDEAGRIYYRAYHVAMHDPRHGRSINNPSTFPVAHKMIQAWLKSDKEDLLKMAHSMAEQTTMMPGCPAYIVKDSSNAATAMRKKGMEVTSIMDAFKNMSMGY